MLAPSCRSGEVSVACKMLIPSHFRPLGSPSRVLAPSPSAQGAASSDPAVVLVNCSSRAFDPSLITQNVNEDTVVGGAPPDFPLLPITALDLTLHGFDGVSGEQIRQRKQHTSRRSTHDRCLSGVGSSNFKTHKR